MAPNASIVLVLFAFAVFFVSSAFSASILECPKNSRFNGCMSRCPVTCSNISNPPTNCVPHCTVGCECMDGYVKVNKSPLSKCVKTFECSLYTTHKKLPYVAMRKMAAAESIQLSQTQNDSTENNDS